jgi:hypothetical protein
MKYIYVKAIERSFQFFFLMIIWEFVFVSLCILMFYFGYEYIAKVLTNLCTYSLLLGAIIIPTPLFIAKLFEKQKCAETKNSKRNKLGNQRYINSSPFSTIIIECVKRLNLYTDRCPQSEYGNNAQDNCYKPEFAHIIYPITLIFRSIIKRLATKCKRYLFNAFFP